MDDAAAAEAAASEVDASAEDGAISVGGEDEAVVVPGQVIEVTGSLIRRDNLTGHGPVTVVSDKELRSKGSTTVNETLEQMPSVSLQGESKKLNNGGEGGATVDLRNLGEGRTLTLVNGNRLAGDLHLIPMPLVERVEVLLDGASAVYGADAVGGVINFILKDDFQGVRLDAHTGISDKGDGQVFSLSGTVGESSARGNVTAHVSYTQEDNIRQSDRSWSRRTVNKEGFDPETGAPVRVIGSEASGAGVTSVGSGDQGQDIIFLPGGGRRYQPFDITSAEHTYDFGQRQWLTAKLRRLAVAVLGHYALSSKVETYIEILFTHRESQTNLAPQAIGNSATNAFPGGFQVPLTNPFVPDDFRQLVQQLEPDARSIALLRRLLEAGDRHSKIIIDSLQVIGGLRGRVARKYDWDLRVNWGQGASTTTIFNSINLARAVETADPELCALNASRGCVVGDYFSPGGLTQDVIDYIRYDDISTASGSQLITQATLTGPVLEIGDREVKFAAGSSFRHEEAEVLPSPIVAGGDSAGNGSSPTVGDLSAYDAFAELSIPLLSKAFLAQQLTADLAGRYSAYDSFGGQFTFRSGLTYAPVADIRLRGSYATAFRAPSIGALYGGSVDSFESVKDPCDGWDTDASIDPTVRQNCMNGGAGIGAVPGGYRQLGSQIRANIGGNRDLQPETARVISMGVVVWPGGPFEGLTLTTDYYRVTVDNAISSPDTQSILDDCYASPALSSPKCELIGRSAEDGSINSLNASVRNIGKLETSGVDLTVNYELGVGSLGQINFGWQGNYLLDFTETIETEVSEFEGTIAPQAGTFTQLRWIARGGFSRGPWSLDNTVRYFGGARLFGVKPDEQPTTSVSAITYWDLAGTYAGDKLGITVGVDNLLDTPPPFIPGENANTNEATYDVVGRFVFTRLSYEF